MKVGIDLGTTNSAIAYVNQDGQPEIIANSEGERSTPSSYTFEKQNQSNDCDTHPSRYF